MNILLNDFLRQQPAAAHPPLPHSTRTGVQINWREEAVKTIEIRRHQIEMAAKHCYIFTSRPGRPAA
jgi:hypothetical protein